MEICVIFLIRINHAIFTHSRVFVKLNIPSLPSREKNNNNNLGSHYLIFRKYNKIHLHWIESPTHPKSDFFVLAYFTASKVYRYNVCHSDLDFINKKIVLTFRVLHGHTLLILWSWFWNTSPPIVWGILVGWGHRQGWRSQ